MIVLFFPIIFFSIRNTWELKPFGRSNKKVHQPLSVYKVWWRYNNVVGRGLRFGAERDARPVRKIHRWLLIAKESSFRNKQKI